jgi:DNA-binding cell septation regulator SpoVG
VTGDPRIVRWQSFVNPAGTLRGFLSVAMPSGLVIHGVKLMISSGGTPWLAMPSVKRLDRAGNPVLDERGKAIWDLIIEFADSAARHRFQEAVLDALRRSHPEAFSSAQAEGGPPAASLATQGSKSTP